MLSPTVVKGEAVMGVDVPNDRLSLRGVAEGVVAGDGDRDTCPKRLGQVAAVMRGPESSSSLVSELLDPRSCSRPFPLLGPR
jgi:hypothetical protein